MSGNRELSVMREMLDDLFPITRSLTGTGNRQTLEYLQRFIPLTTREIQSGQKVFDWVVPDEWQIHAAWIAGPDGKKIVDFEECNLHVVGYSIPVNDRLTFAELEPRLHTLPDLPNAVPYRTSYYKKDWGFCVTQKQYQELKTSPGPLEVVIDSQFDVAGSLTTGELVIPGNREDEILVSTYICHPSMANDNLSGVITTTLLAKEVCESGTPVHTWRFLFVPETIGPIAYLSSYPDIIKRTIGGLVVTCCGGPGPLGYKRTFQGDHAVDRAIEIAFRDLNIEPNRYEFSPLGSDERQYSSPGIRIPVATICKDKYHEFKEYHTSEDNLSFVKPEYISASLEVYRRVQAILDSNTKIVSTVNGGEPQLGARGLYPTIGGANKQAVSQDSNGSTGFEIDSVMWTLFLADGEHDLISIAEKTGSTFSDIVSIVDSLERTGLVTLA